MNSFEFNKIFAAVLVAGITAMLGGFIAGKIVHPDLKGEDAVPIEGIESAGGGGAAAGPKGPEPIMALIATADIAKGEKLSKACAACHSFDKGGPNKVGPNLYAVMGGPLAHIAGFEYSVALKEHGGTWDYDAMNHFLYKPKDYIKGTKMNYAGLKKPEDRAAIIAWLRTQGSSGYALPTDAQIAAEAAALAPPPSAAEEAKTEGEAAPVEASTTQEMPKTEAEKDPSAAP
jgi:cytochrome c